MENIFIDLDTMAEKKGYIIESTSVSDTIRALAIIDFQTYLVTANKKSTIFLYNSTTHRIYNSLTYHGHYIVQFCNNTLYWYCPYLDAKGCKARHKSLDIIIELIDKIEMK